MDLSDLSKEAIEQKKKMIDMKDKMEKRKGMMETEAFRAASAEKRKAPERAAAAAKELRSRSAEASRMQSKAKLQSEMETKEEVIREALRLMKRYNLTPQKSPSSKLSLAENQAILSEVIAQLGMRRGRRKFQAAVVQFTQIIQGLFSDASPIGPFRVFHANHLTEEVCQGEEFEDIVTDLTMQYGWFFAELGPISRYALAITEALMHSYAMGRAMASPGIPPEVKAQMRNSEVLNQAAPDGLAEKYSELA
jgi:hypothetical protein